MPSDRPGADANPVWPGQERVQAGDDFESGEDTDIMLMLQGSGPQRHRPRSDREPIHDIR